MEKRGRVKAKMTLHLNTDKYIKSVALIASTVSSAYGCGRSVLGFQHVIQRHHPICHTHSRAGKSMHK